MLLSALQSIKAIPSPALPHLVLEPEISFPPMRQSNNCNQTSGKALFPYPSDSGIYSYLPFPSPLLALLHVFQSISKAAETDSSPTSSDLPPRHHALQRFVAHDKHEWSILSSSTPRMETSTSYISLCITITAPCISAAVPSCQKRHFQLCFRGIAEEYVSSTEKLQQLGIHNVRSASTVH